MVQPRLLCKEAKTKTRKKNRDDTVTDSLFWPVMHRLDVRQRLDPILQGNSRILQPHVIQPYHVPIPFDSLARGQTVPNAVLATHTGSNRAGTGFGTFHDRCLYSLWMHFTDYCMTQNGTAETDGSSASVGAGIGTSTCSLNQGRSDTSTHSRSNPRNKYLGTFRLPFFVALAGSESTSISQKENHGTPQQLIYEEEEIISDDEDSDLQHNPLPQGLSRAPSAPPGCAHEEPGSSSVSPTSILEGMWYLENAAASAASIVEVDKMILSCGKPPGLLSSHEEPQLSSLLLTTPALVSSDVRHCSSYYSSSVHSPSRQLHSPPNLSPNRAPPTHLSGYFNRQQPSRSDPNICRYQAHYEQCSYY